MLELQSISVAGRLQAVTGSVLGGKVYHFLGPNGAGKSSLIAAMAGLLPLSAGQVRLLQRPLQEYSLAHLALRRCFHQQHQQLAFSLTARELISFYTDIAELPHQLEQALNISGFLDKPLLTLSGGQQQRVYLAQALLQVWASIEQGQALILLDEPLQGLDVRHQHQLFNLLDRLAASGNAVVISHHDLVMAQCQYGTSEQLVWLLHQGQLQAQGEATKVLSHENISRVFECELTAARTASGQQVLIPDPMSKLD